MNSINEARQALESIQTQNRFEFMTEVTAIFTQLMETHNIRPVIVGGLAVEIYTRGQYTTQDIDLVFSRRDLADKTLVEMGFIKEGRHWYHPELEISIEIPGDMLEDADIEKVTKLHLPSGRHVYVIGIEDIILDRLRACVHWKSSSDCEWGYRMLDVHQSALDIEYMKKETKTNHPAEFKKLKEWLNAVNR